MTRTSRAGFAALIAAPAAAACLIAAAAPAKADCFPYADFVASAESTPPSALPSTGCRTDGIGAPLNLLPPDPGKAGRIVAVPLPSPAEAGPEQSVRDPSFDLPAIY
ncbi:hypothetical protein [Azospirillum sp. TSO5]|uniref:hypothetical protein n=1 Tax=Azospirillum sp. TSO5 TaxID=716760 RepID=UPI0011B2183E|nr:hypothetical protein [Azospirillum sp. TSO5]